jgi:carboxypeptidase C (cathepsin A)
MRGAMTRQPGMRVFLASGLYDLATPYFAADYTMAHLMLPPDLRGNITTQYYESGHMMYAHRASLREDEGRPRPVVRPRCCPTRTGAP